MYYSNVLEVLWFLFRRLVRSDKVCIVNMFIYYFILLILYIIDIEKNNRNYSFIF